MDLSFDRIRESLERVVKDALDASAARGDDPPLALVAFDTPGIQDYIFKVRRPVDIYSGSQLVAKFTDPTADDSVFSHLRKAGISEDAVIYAGGGGGLVLVPAHLAEKAQTTLRRILHDATEGDLASAVATLKIRRKDLDPGPVKALSGGVLAELFEAQPASPYAATIAAVTALLARERSRLTSLAPSIPSDRQDDRCSACGGRLATKDDRAREGDLCSPCGQRRKHGGIEKRLEEQARTFEDLVEGTGSKMMAVIYADGANLGAAFQKLGSMAQHRALSRIVEHAFREGEKRAREAVPLPVDERARLRFQTPLCGGDDLVLVLPAMAALPAVRALVPEIEKHFDFTQDPRLREAFEKPGGLRTAIERFGVGVGIAIADHHFPMRFLLGHAKELLRSAKHKIRESGCRSAVDFMVLTSGNPLSGSLRDLRRQRYRVEARRGEPELRLTRRPYNYWEFAELVTNTATLARVPRSQVYAMRQEVLRGYQLSRSMWRYQHARSREKEGWALYRKARKVKLEDAEALDAMLWRDGNGDAAGAKCTDLLDAVEVLDLVKPEGDSE